jgi:DNA-binding MarR family transcriptional regulator
MGNAAKPRTLRDPLEDLIGYQLRRASLLTLSALSESFEALGLRPTEAIIIRFVQANPGCNQAEIGRALGVQRTNMVPIIGGLVDAGTISRKPADGRTHALHLTRQGEALHDKLAKLTLEHERHFFGDVDEDTRAILLRTLREVRAKAQAPARR